MLLPAPPPPAAGGHPVEPPAAGVGDLAAMEHEVAASVRAAGKLPEVSRLEPELGGPLQAGFTA